MKILDSPPDQLVTRSHRIIPGENGYRDAEYVYGFYLNSGFYIETLAVLSLACRTKSGKQRLGIITPRIVDNFRAHSFIRTTSEDVRGWLTDRGHVAVSMVDAELVEGDIDAKLNEPFLHHQILPTLHAGQAQIPCSHDVYYYSE